MNINLLKYSNFFLAFSGIVVFSCIISVAVFGLELGIEFTGGSVLELRYEQEQPPLESIREQLSAMEVGLVSVQQVGEKGVLIRTQYLSEEAHRKVLAALGKGAQEVRFESIGPTIGKELRGQAVILLLLSLGSIVLYVMLAFRKLTRPVRFWQWSLATLLALLHDISIPLGVMAYLGQFYGAQITIPVVVALLTVVGYSVNDTVVIFDRVRENLIKRVGVDFADTVWQSLRQTFVRSLNTSVTVLLVVLAILFFGGETLRYFALTMTLGIVAGSWSSLFIAPFLLEKWVGKRPS